MELREENPLVDSDLELIITAFESALTKSRDVDSVFVPFRREIHSFATYPQSIINSIDSVPSVGEVEEDNSNSQTDRSPAIQTPETVLGKVLGSIEDGNDEDDWAEKVKNWVSECVPCKGEFKRTISSMDADFFSDIGEGWDSALDTTLDRLKGLENLLQDVDASIPFCEIGNVLKGNCVPDIEKLIFVLSMFMGRMEFEVELDLSIFDSFLTAALSPVFNELAANLDLIDTLAINPIRCVLDQIQYQVNNAPRIAEQARSAILEPARAVEAARYTRMQEALRRSSEASSSLPTPTGANSEAAKAARRVRDEEQTSRASSRRGEQGMVSTIERANQVFNRTKDSIDFLDRFQDYVSVGTDWLKEKKEWLLNLIEEFVNTGLDRWNNQMQFARGKTDILTFISIMKAMVEAARSGDLSCGPDSGSLTEDDIANIADYWKHPSESLEIIVEDGNIITRRIPDLPSYQEADNRGLITGGEGTSEVLSNIVVRRSISSCLKKVTTDEADRIQHWIQQLEQEVTN